jgi:YhcH/YjgK/YiaL family protein
MALNKGFLKAVEFLSNPDLIELQVNKYEIDGDRVYAMVSKDVGRNKKDAQLEIHSKYIDIQLVLEGTDEMAWKSAALCKHPAMEFDKKADIQFFQ